MSFLFFDFFMFPKIVAIIGDIESVDPNAMEILKTRMIYATVGYIIIVCLVNLFLYSKFNVLNEEKQKIENMLKINQQDQSVLDRMNSIKKKMNFYDNFTETIVILIAGLAFLMIVYLILDPVTKLISASI